ncbi:DUF4309 domain-containing protein [Bacillus sp. JCM 19034]|uniref:DUF4309 domain-containing protein n=1 Tax=Bacillus sp. JCM 19034 TaxID=1481928 RepID=UPI000781B869|nr:DUF4309 domain-containing protein [Bacillus sp. JCM 19034]
MKVVKLLLFSSLLFIMASCGQVSIELNEQANAAVKLHTELSEKEVEELNESEILTFDWIEKGYSGIFAPTNDQLGETYDAIIKREGEPIETGYYEGGVYLQYGEVTYFINPETNKSVAIALQIEDQGLTHKEMKKALGTPDISEMNEMDGYWMFCYDLNEYQLMFEAKSEKDTIEYVWLREIL